MLVFSLAAGESFYVGDQKITLLGFNREEVGFRSVGETRWFALGELHPLWAAPGRDHKDIRICGGRRRERTIRIGVEAPLDVKVLRERLYLQQLALRGNRR